MNIHLPTLFFYRYHKNKKHSKNHPTFKFVSDDLMDLNASFDLIMENQKERSNDPEEENITEEQTLHNNYIITENIETDNVTKVTTEENVTMNPDTVPEHNENFVTLKLDHLNSIIYKIVLSPPKTKFLRNQFNASKIVSFHTFYNT